MYAQIQADFGGTIFRLLHALPLPLLTVPLVIISSVVYGVTTYFISMQFSGGELNPSVSMRAFVGLMIGATGLTFLYIGDFNGLKSLGIIAGAPFFVILGAYMLSIVKMLKAIRNNSF